jgi:hypothetical protein
MWVVIDDEHVAGSGVGGAAKKARRGGVCEEEVQGHGGGCQALRGGKGIRHTLERVVTVDQSVKSGDEDEDVPLAVKQV